MFERNKKDRKITKRTTPRLYLTHQDPGISKQENTIVKVIIKLKKNQKVLTTQMQK